MAENQPAFLFPFPDFFALVFLFFSLYASLSFLMFLPAPALSASFFSLLPL